MGNKGSRCTTGEKAPAWKHGYDTKDGIYRSWLMMKNRCDNPRSPDYKNYGGRGIHYDSAWAYFRNFLADMGEREDGMTLERSENDGPYCKANCHWATRTEQNRNSRNCNYLLLGGINVPMSCAAKMHGLHPDCLRQRMKSGWEVERALLTPSRCK